MDYYADYIVCVTYTRENFSTFVDVGNKQHPHSDIIAGSCPWATVSIFLNFFVLFVNMFYVHSG